MEKNILSNQEFLEVIEKEIINKSYLERFPHIPSQMVQYLVYESDFGSIDSTNINFLYLEMVINEFSNNKVQ